jgi:hypothetical protein
MRKRTRLTVLATAGALAGMTITACSGPAAPLDIGTQNAPISLVLGQLKAVQEAPLGPLAGPPAPQRLPYYQPPAPGAPQVLPTLPPLPLGPCPDFDPLAPVLGVGRTLAAPPVKATYPYRAQVIDSYPGATLKPFVGNSQWTVETGPVDSVDGGYDVSYTVKLAAATTKRVLRILPHDIGSDPSSDPTDQTNPNGVINTVNGLGVLPTPLPSDLPNLSAYGLAGIYLKSQETITPDGVQSFTPSQPIALLQLRQLTGATDPASAAASAITSVGYDPTTSAVMAFRSTVLSVTSKINACGTPLQAVQIGLSSPNMGETKPPAPPIGPDAGAALFAQRRVAATPTDPKFDVLAFQEKIDFGLQYGGLVLQDALAVAPLSGVQVDTKNPPATPTAVPDPDPTSIESAVLGSVLTWAVQHMIFKTETFTINVKPQYPKVAS